MKNEVYYLKKGVYLIVAYTIYPEMRRENKIFKNEAMAKLAIAKQTERKCRSLGKPLF